MGFGLQVAILLVGIGQCIPVKLVLTGLYFVVDANRFQKLVDTTVAWPQPLLIQVGENQWKPVDRDRPAADLQVAFWGSTAAGTATRRGG